MAISSLAKYCDEKVSEKYKGYSPHDIKLIYAQVTNTKHQVNISQHYCFQSKSFINLLQQTNMNHQIILELDREESDGYTELDEHFFIQLHQHQNRYIKLKHGRKTKETQNQLTKVIMDLVASYTDCIDYFGAYGDVAIAYFQLKLKGINQHFQMINNRNTTKNVNQSNHVEVQSKKDLGSISEQTCIELLPGQQRENSIVSKQALNHNLMVYLQNQDITTHLKESMKKQKKIHTVITNSLKQQDDLLTQRKKNRDSMNKSRVFLSFSENVVDMNRSPDPSDTFQLMITDMQALEANSPQELRQLSSRKQSKLKGVSSAILIQQS